MISFLSSVWIGKYIPLYFHSRPIRNRLIDTALLRLFCIFNYDRAQFIFQLSPRRIANLQINRDFWYRIDSTSFHDLSFEFAFTNRSNQQEEEEDVIVRWKNTGGGERKGRIKLMTHKRVCGNRARRIVNFRRFDVASVSAFSCGGKGERAGLSQRSKSTKFRGFICPSRMRRERERARIHTCIISSQAGEYLWSFAEDEWEIGRESFVILCALFIWNASNVPPERRCFVTFLMIYLAFGGSYRLVPTIRFDFPLLFRTRSRKCSLLPPSFSSISIRSPRG